MEDSTIDIEIQNEGKTTLSGFSFDELGQLISRTREDNINNFAEFLELIKNMFPAFVAFGECKINTHYFVKTIIGEVPIVVAFLKGEKFTSITNERLKHRLWELYNKDLSKKTLLEKMGLKDYSPINIENKIDYFIPNSLFEISNETEQLIKKFYPDIDKESVSLLHRMIQYESEQIGVSVTGLYKLLNISVIYSINENGDFVDSNGYKLASNVYNEIIGNIPPVSFMITALKSLGYIRGNLGFTLKLVPYEWNKENILKHIQLNKDCFIDNNVPELGYSEDNVILKTENGQVELPFPTWIFLDAILPLYESILDKNPELAQKRHAKIRKDIKGWLKRNFNGFTAKDPEGFVEWLLNNKEFAPFEIVYIIYFRNNSPKVWVDFKFNRPNWEIQVSKKDIIDYCTIQTQEMESYLPIEKKTKKLYEKIYETCLDIQSRMHFWNVDENTRNTQIRSTLNLSYNYFVKDQTLEGESYTGIRSGSLDLLIYEPSSRTMPLAICEGLNLDSLQTATIKNHIMKLENNYDKWGLVDKYLIIYAEVNENFLNFKERYLEFINNYLFAFDKIGEIEVVEEKYAESIVFKSKHSRAGKTVNIYHILIKFPKKKKN